MEIKVVKRTEMRDEETVEHPKLPEGAPKPFVKKGPDSKSKPTSAALHPELPRRVMEIPGGPKRSEHILPINNNANTLTVGRNISLNGEIIACEKLIVEGTVEATLNDAHVIEVKKGGCFKGSADVTAASISGEFAGTLVAKDLLTVHGGGHVEGSVRYGRIIIEAGGEITGDMSSLEIQQKPTADQNKPTN
jgi:cytoskeletal protein CcmA (bactofilin family)